MERPSCWSTAVWGAGVGTEVGVASSSPAPHTVFAAIAEAPQEQHTHPCQTNGAAGTPIPNAGSAPVSPLPTLAVLKGSPRTERREVEMTSLSMMAVHVPVQRTRGVRLAVSLFF